MDADKLKALNEFMASGNLPNRISDAFERGWDAKAPTPPTRTVTDAEIEKGRRKKLTWEEKRAILNRGKNKTFYPDCNRGEAWAEGYMEAMRDKANTPKV